MPLEISFYNLLLHDWMPFLCRSKKLHALDRVLQKANYRIHKELDVASVLRRVRESNYFVQSFFTNETFDADEIQTFTELHHDNIVDPNLPSDDSIYMEFNPMQISNKDFLFEQVWNDIFLKEKQRYEEEMLIRNGGRQSQH